MVNKAQGFTLIEIMVAIAVLGVVSTLLVSTFMGAQKRPHDAAAVKCGKAIIDAQVQFRAETYTYAGTVAALGEDVAQACAAQDVHVHSHSGTPPNNPGAAVCECMNADPNVLAFVVFSRRGSGYYRFWNIDRRTPPDRLDALVRW